MKNLVPSRFLWRLLEVAAWGPLGPVAADGMRRAARAVGKKGLAQATKQLARAIVRRRRLAVCLALCHAHATFRRRRRWRRIAYGQLMRDINRGDLEAVISANNPSGKAKNDFTSMFRWLPMEEQHIQMRWMNTVALKLWQLAESTIDDIVINRLDPLLENLKLPRGVSQIGIDTISLGRIPPTITRGAIISAARFRDGLVMDLDINWEGEADVIISVSGPAINAGLQPLAVSLDDLKIKGTLRIVMDHYVDLAPFFHCAKVMFMTTPVITYSIGVQAISGFGSMSIDSVPGLGSTLRNIVKTLMVESLVLPNHVTLPMRKSKILKPLIPPSAPPSHQVSQEEETDATSEISNQSSTKEKKKEKKKKKKKKLSKNVLLPAGRLQITLCSAKGLVRTDYFSESDPYCVIAVDGSTSVNNFSHPFHRNNSTGPLYPCKAHPRCARSSIKHNNQNPVWNEEFTFDVYDPRSEAVLLQICDSDFLGLGEATILGRATMPLAQFDVNKHGVDERTIWVPLHLSHVERSSISGSASTTDFAGELQLNVSWIPSAELFEERRSLCDEALTFITRRVNKLESHHVMQREMRTVFSDIDGHAKELGAMRTNKRNLLSRVSSTVAETTTRAKGALLLAKSGEPVPFPPGSLGDFSRRAKHSSFRRLMRTIPSLGLPQFAINPSVDRGRILNQYIVSIWPVFAARVMHECDLGNAAARNGELWSPWLEEMLRPRVNLFPGTLPPYITGVNVQNLGNSRTKALMADFHVRIAQDGFMGASIAPFGLEACRIGFEWSECQTEFMARATASPLFAISPYFGDLSCQLLDPNMFSWIDSCFTLRIREPFSAMMRTLVHPLRAVREAVSRAEPPPDAKPVRTLSFRPMDYIPFLGFAFHEYCRRMARATAGYPNTTDFHFVDLEHRAVASHLDLSMVASGTATLSVLGVRGLSRVMPADDSKVRNLNLRLTVEAGCPITRRLSYNSRTLQMQTVHLDHAGNASMNGDELIAAVYSKSSSLHIAVGLYEGDDEVISPVSRDNRREAEAEQPFDVTTLDGYNIHKIRALGETERSKPPISDVERKQARRTLARIRHLYYGRFSEDHVAKKLPKYNSSKDGAKKKKKSLSTLIYRLVFKRLRPIYLGDKTRAELNRIDGENASSLRASRADHMNEESAAVILQSAWRRKQAHAEVAAKRSWHHRRVFAATMIQAWWRGLVTRRKLENKGLLRAGGNSKGSSGKVMQQCATCSDAVSRQSRARARISTRRAPEEQVLHEVGQMGRKLVGLAYIDAAEIAAEVADGIAKCDGAHADVDDLSKLVSSDAKCLRARAWVPLDGLSHAQPADAPVPMCLVEVRLARFSNVESAHNRQASEGSDGTSSLRKPVPSGNSSVASLTHLMPRTCMGCVFVELLSCDNLATRRNLMSKIEVEIGSRSRRTARSKGRSYFIGELFLFPATRYHRDRDEYIIVRASEWVPAWRRFRSTTLGEGQTKLSEVLAVGQLRKKVHLIGGRHGHTGSVDVQLTWREHTDFFMSSKQDNNNAVTHIFSGTT